MSAKASGKKQEEPVLCRKYECHKRAGGSLPAIQQLSVKDLTSLAHAFDSCGESMRLCTQVGAGALSNARFFDPHPRPSPAMRRRLCSDVDFLLGAISEGHIERPERRAHQPFEALLSQGSRGRLDHLV